VPLDFLALYSSAVVAHGGLGESDYCAANCFMDAFARRARERGAPVIAIDWGPWRRDSWAGAAAGARELRARYGISDEEGAELLTRIIAARRPQILVAQQDPARLAARWAELALAAAAPVEPSRCHPRPPLRVPYRAPRTDLERQIVDAWKRFLGLDRVGVDDQFFELGGTSLIGLTIIQQLEQELAVAVSAADLFAAPTPGTLATLVAERRGESGDEQPAGGRGEQRRRLAGAAAARRARQNQRAGR
jgi:acyl carrier protein